MIINFSIINIHLLNKTHRIPNPHVNPMTSGPNQLHTKPVVICVEDDDINTNIAFSLHIKMVRHLLRCSVSTIMMFQEALGQKIKKTRQAV